MLVVSRWNLLAVCLGKSLNFLKLLFSHLKNGISLALRRVLLDIK